MTFSARPTVTLIEGDGIGPEIAAATLEVIAAAGGTIDWDRQLAGQTAAERVGDPLPAATVASITAHQVALKGPLGNVPEFRKKIQDLVKDEGARDRLLKELGIE